MATLRIAALEGSTTIFLTSIGVTTGTPNVLGYPLTQLIGLIHEATITGLTGPFYAVAKDNNGIELGYITKVTMTDDTSLIDTTDSSYGIAESLLEASTTSPIRSDVRLVNGEAIELFDEDVLVEANTESIITAMNTNPPLTVSVNASVLPNTYKLSVSIINGSQDIINGSFISVLNTSGVSVTSPKVLLESMAQDFYLSSGDYLIRVITPKGYINPVDTAITIVSSNISSEIVVTEETVLPAADFDLCRVMCRILDSSGEPIENAIVSAIPSDDRASISQTLLAQVKSTSITDSEGYCDLYLVSSSNLTSIGRRTYSINISSSNSNIFRSFEVLVPDNSPVWLEELLNNV